MKKINLIFIMAFALMFAFGGLNDVLADEYKCFDTMITNNTVFTDLNGKISGYKILGDVTDDEANIYLWGFKSHSDQVIFKFNQTMILQRTYDIDESGISNQKFAKNGLAYNGNDDYIYGYNEYTGKLYKMDVGGCASGACTTTTHFSLYDIIGTYYDTFSMTFTQDGSNVNVPTNILFSQKRTISGVADNIYDCPFTNNTFISDCTEKTQHSYGEQGGITGWIGLEFQEDSTDQEVIFGLAGNSWLEDVKILKTYDYSVMIERVDTPVIPVWTTLNNTYDNLFSGISHLSTDGTYFFSSREDDYHGVYYRYWSKYTPCETIDSGVYVSVNEFNLANQAKAINDETDFAVYDEEATLGWQAFSFINTLDSFDGEYSVDGGAFIDIIGLQTFGDADAGYLVADFGEDFDDTTYKDAGNTTADWDTVNEWVVLDTGTTSDFSEDFTTYETADWTDPQPAFATIVSEELKITSTDSATNSVNSIVNTYNQDTLKARVKFTDNASNIDQGYMGFYSPSGTHYAMFLLGPAGWFAATKDGTTSNSQDTGLAIDTAYHDLEIVWAAASVKFYVDDVLKVTSSANLPTIDTTILNRTIAKAGVTTNMYIDYITINEVTAYDSSNIAQTLTVDSTAETITKFNLLATETTPANTTIIYDVSCDGGSNWATSVTESTSTACDTDGSDLRVKATLETTDTAVTPTINSFAINYTTDDTDATTPSFFTTDYFSYDWDTTLLANGQYKFKMTATDDDIPENSDDSTSQEFIVCHGDTLQIYLSPDYSTDLYTSLACINTVTIDTNSTDEIIIKAVNQDSSNPQSFTLNIENGLNDDRFYDVYTSSDGTTWASTPDIDLTRKELKTWTGTTWNHAQTDELSTSETKYYKYVYRKPYAIVTTDIEGYESLTPDDSKIDLWNVAQGDIRFNDLTCTNLLGGSHCTSFIGQSSYSTGAIESTDKLSMVASSTAFDIMLVAKYELTTPGIPKLHVQAKSDLGDSWGDVFISLNGATAIATGVPMTTTWANYSASMTADSYVRIYIEEGSGAVSDVHMSQIYVVPNKYFTGVPIFRKANGDVLDMQPGGSSTANSEYYLSEGDDFSVHVEYYDKEGVIDTAQIVINKTGSADIIKTVDVAMSPTVEYLYTGDLILGGFIDTSDTVSEITGTVYLIDEEVDESFKTTEDVIFRQFPYGAGDYKSGIIMDTGSQFVGRAPKGSVSIQMTRTNPLAKVRMRIWDTDTNGTFTEASSNFTKDFIKGTDFVCAYNDCSFSFDLTGEWVWSNDGKFFVQLEPFFSTSGTQPYTASFLTVPIIISQSSYQHMTLTFLDSAMDRETRHSDLIGDATSDYRDLISVNNNETKNFLVRLKTSDGANVVGDVNVYLALFKYGDVPTDATKGNGTAISEDISAGGVLETTCRAEASEDDCIAISGCEWFTSGTPSCSTIGAPISYYKHEFNAYTGINYFYFSTPLLDESGAFLDEDRNFGLFAYASDQTFTDAELTGKYGNKKVVLSQYIPGDMAVPYSTNSLYYVQKPLSVGGLGAEGICVNQDGFEVGGGGCAGISEDWEAFCDKDGILGTFTGVYRPGKFRCTWGEQDDQFCDMYETCEVPILVTDEYAASRPFIYAFGCSDPVTGYYSPQCVWAIRGGDTPVTQVDYLIWNDNTNWGESNPDYQQWVKFSIPYEELSEVDINATYIAQLADGPLNMASAAESLFLSAGGIGHTLICGWGFILSFGANNCNEITINSDTDTLIGTIVNGVQFININDYQQLVKRYEPGFSTSEQCSAVGYTWDSTAGRCYSSVDPTNALKYAGENDISINKSNWFASTYYNQSTQASYNGQTAIIIDDLPSSDTNTTLKIPVNFTMRIWWNDGGEMKSEQRTMKQIVPVNYTNTTACGNFNTLGGWYDKFACLTVDVTTLVTDFFFFFLIMIVLASIILGAIRATRGR